MKYSQTDKIVKWWEAPKGEAGPTAFQYVGYLDTMQTTRSDRNKQSIRLYGNQNMAGLSPYNYTTDSNQNLPQHRVKINIVASMVDTVVSKIGKMRPRVTFLTSGGNFSVQRRAKKLTAFMSGMFYRNKIFKLHRDMFRDACIFDIGAIKHYRDGNNIVSERVLGTELYTDDADSVYGKPRSLYQVKYVSKDSMKKLFPKHAAAIDVSEQSFNVDGIAASKSDEFIVVVEAWHLGTKGKGGRHLISTSEVELLDEKYTRDYFPFTFLRWAELPIGFWGQSLASRLTGNQIEINKMLRLIQKSFHLGSAFKVFLEHGSKVVREHMNNDVGSIVYYRGTPPQYATPQTVHPEYFNHLNFLIQQSYQEAGISQLSANSRKPAGLDSGKAMREYNQIESERFAAVSQDYEASFLDTARIYLDLLEDMHKSGQDLQVVAESERLYKSIKWSDVRLEGNEFIMQMFPTSMLPHEPSGRLAFIQEMMQAGMISQEWGTRLLDIPDTEAYSNMKNSYIDVILMVMEEILDGGQFIPPEPNDNIALGIEICKMVYHKARVDRAPENVLEQLRRWHKAATVVMNKATSAAQMGGEQAMLSQPGISPLGAARGPSTQTQTPQPPGNISV